MVIDSTIAIAVASFYAHSLNTKQPPQYHRKEAEGREMPGLE